MPYILATTDFSATARNAVDYAAGLASFLGYDLAIIHCYSLPIAFTGIPIPSPVNEAELAAQESMENLVAEMNRRFPQVNVRERVAYGDLIDTLQELSDNNEAPWLAVAGNSHSPESPAWMESTLLQAFRKVKFPVLGVPQEIRFEQVRKVGFAFDNNYRGADVALVQLRELIRVLNAELHVLYAADSKTDNAVDSAAQKLLAEVGPLYHVNHADDIDGAMIDFVAHYHLDWIIILPRKHGLIDGIFHKSHTKMMVNHSMVPVLALHDNS